MRPISPVAGCPLVNQYPRQHRENKDDSKKKKSERKDFELIFTATRENI